MSSSKRRRRRTGVKEEIRLCGDTTLRSTEVFVNSHRQFVSVPISPKKQKVTPWTDKTSWEPEDRSDFALDPSAEWYSEALTGDVYDKHGWEDVPTLENLEGVQEGVNITSANACGDAQGTEEVKKIKRTLRSVCNMPLILIPANVRSVSGVRISTGDCILKIYFWTR